jgi:hypothetical protein
VYEDKLGKDLTIEQGRRPDKITIWKCIEVKTVSHDDKQNNLSLYGAKTVHHGHPATRLRIIRLQNDTVIGESQPVQLFFISVLLLLYNSDTDV